MAPVAYHRLPQFARLFATIHLQRVIPVNIVRFTVVQQALAYLYKQQALAYLYKQQALVYL